MITKKRLRYYSAIMAVFMVVAAAPTAGAQPVIGPDQVAESDLTVVAEYVATTPFVLGAGSVQNLGSPVAIKNKLYTIDQNDAIYRFPTNEGFQQIFHVSEAPDGLALDNRQSILNIAPGPQANSVYVMFQAGSEPTTPIPIYRMPAPLPDICCIPGAPIPVDDLYRIGPIPGPLGPFLGTTRTEYQVLYEYKLAGDHLQEPRPIAAFETQSGPTHNGGGMLTLPDGRVLFATGDALPFGAEGRAAPQDHNEAVSKLLIIDPDDGSIEVAAHGIRNVQHLEYVADDSAGVYVAFGDIGGVTAEEVNFVSLDDLLDTSIVENFGWGRNADGNAREGTFYVGPGLPIVPGTEPPVLSVAPSPEAGFIQPQAQYGRNDPNGGVAVSGPVTSTESLSSITALFSDLSSGILYATSAEIDDVAATVFKVNLVDEDGNELDSLQDLGPGGRVDPRFFRFPDGTAGVLLEATGDIYRLTQLG